MICIIPVPELKVFYPDNKVKFNLLVKLNLT